MVSCLGSKKQVFLSIPRAMRTLSTMDTRLRQIRPPQPCAKLSPNPTMRRMDQVLIAVTFRQSFPKTGRAKIDGLKYHHLLGEERKINQNQVAPKQADSVTSTVAK